MKVKLITITLWLTLIVQVIQADSYEGYVSKLDGVGLWALGPASNVPFISKGLAFGENPEYAIHCDGKNKLYIFELDSRGFICTTILWFEFKGWNAPERSVEHSEFNQNDLVRAARLASEESFSECENLDDDEKYECLETYDNAYQSVYIVKLEGLRLSKQAMYAVSKNKLAKGDWLINSLSDSLITELQEKFAKKVSCPKEIKCYPIISKQPTYQKFDGQIDRGEISKWAISISNDDNEVAILPVAYAIGSPTDIDAVRLIVSIMVKKLDSWEEIGKLSGNLIRVGADLDSDGFPEIIVDESADYSVTVQYYKIFPSIGSFITYSHN